MRLSEIDGAYAFAANPTQSSQDQTIFWAPEVLPSIIPVVRCLTADSDLLALANLSTDDFRRASDGWHVVLRIRGNEHRLWFRQLPMVGESYAAELPFDEDFELRNQAARRLWRTLDGRGPGPALHELSKQRRRRLAMALRALDARVAGKTYREIAELLFGTKSIPEKAWKTHDLRNRTIRLVQLGFALMRGGYRDLLRPPRRKK